MDPLEQLKMEARALAAFGSVTPETLAAVQANADSATGNSPFVGGMARQAPAPKTETTPATPTKKEEPGAKKAAPVAAKPKPKTSPKPGANDLNVKAGSRQVPASKMPKPEVAPTQKDTLSPINSALQKTSPSQTQYSNVQGPGYTPLSVAQKSDISPGKYFTPVTEGFGTAVARSIPRALRLTTDVAGENLRNMASTAGSTGKEFGSMLGSGISAIGNGLSNIGKGAVGTAVGAGQLAKNTAKGIAKTAKYVVSEK